MTQLVIRIKEMLTREEGQALAEYGLILGLIALTAVIALGLLGGAISAPIDKVIAGFGS